MATALLVGRRIRVRGQVQGVGFRPHAWRLAGDLGLAGTVANDGEGVIIAAWGAEPALDRFVARLVADAPPLARIDAIEQADLEGPAPRGFAILASGAGAARTGIAPDAATCPACRAELTDPADRRHGYAFGNCTHCGPRLSIVTAIPYDRATTAMADFAMCPDCRAEYENPADRRFHAQPIACPACGPGLWLEPAQPGDPLETAAALLRAGQIVAIKGIGGFHLACDAANGAAVAALRRRKARDAKPFALMVRDVAMAERFCTVAAPARALLESPAAPIVLLPRRLDGDALLDGLAPGQDHLGMMLPYAPLHHLLMAMIDGPLVMTSGNRSDEPQATDNDAARERLAGLADAWLMHDRAIVNRLDDSVMALDGARPFFIRRARGFAPAPIRLHPSLRGLPRVLAMGGELKATFCLLADGQAILSQHIGDLEDAAALGDYRRMLDLYRQLFDFVPEVVAIDGHGDYLSSRLGADLAAACGARLVRVPHHHAHMAACLADAGIGRTEGREGIFGLMLDGLGLGPDGTLWGGEVLAGGYARADRVARIDPVALPGGNAAMREPWRNLVAHLAHAFGPGWRNDAGALAAHLPEAPRVALVERMIATGTNAPLCSSAGRLFDALAAALGIYADRLGHEAQAAMALEALARPWLDGADPYPFAIAADAPLTIGWRPLWAAVLADLAQGTDKGRIAARFHKGLAAALAAAVERAGGAGRTVALSGGVFQNRILLAEMGARLEALGCTVLRHGQVPANDGGLSLGQAVLGGLAAERSA